MGVRKSQIPCPQDCKDRSGECHASCPIYRKAYNESLKRYERNAQKRKQDDVLSVGIEARMKKMGKKQRQV